MNKLSPKKAFTIIIVGVTLTVISFAVLMINLFSLNGKAGQSASTCQGDCSLSNMALISHTGMVFFWIGLVVAVTGIIFLIAGQKPHKHK